jgi:hypothetical protein
MRNRPASNHLVPNPAWANNVIEQLWHRLQTETPQRMPRLDMLQAEGDNTLVGEVREFGCGFYGCVYPTVDPRVVMKITTDDTEAEFASNLSPTLIHPVCTDYYKVVELNLQHDGRKVYILRRQEAHLVGKILEAIAEAHGHKTLDRAFELIWMQHKNAEIAYQIMKGARKRLIALDDYIEQLTPRQLNTLKKADATKAAREWASSVADLAVSDIPELSGLFRDILEVFHRQHILFGDVHNGNLGAIHSPDGGVRWVITDPGHVAVINM